MKSNSKAKAKALKTTRGAALITAATLTLALMFLGCKQPETPEPPAPPVRYIVLTIGATNPIQVTAKTAGGSDIAVEGCHQKTLKNGQKTALNATGQKVILKGNIIELNCEDNQLTAIDVKGCPALKVLVCPRNKLTELNVQGLTALGDVNARNNEITKLNVKGCTALWALDVAKNKLTELDVKGCTSLKRLYCGHNNFANFDLKSYNVETLSCGGNGFTNLEVKGTTLVDLYCGKTPTLTSLKVEDAPNLTTLGCSDSSLTSLTITNCPKLNELDCSRNKLSASAFTQIFNDLPMRTADAKGRIKLYRTVDGNDDNFKDFTSASAPQTLKDAFNKAKNEKNWGMKHWIPGKVNWTEIQ
jgi:regulator of chromosome condensation, RCC1 (fragment)